jgi:hypothetical protein
VHSIYFGLIISGFLAVMECFRAAAAALLENAQVFALGTPFTRIMLKHRDCVFVSTQRDFSWRGDASVAMRVLILANLLNIVWHRADLRKELFTVFTLPRRMANRLWFFPQLA